MEIIKFIWKHCPVFLLRTFLSNKDGLGISIAPEYLYYPLLIIHHLFTLCQIQQLRTGYNEWPVDASPVHLKEALEGSLKRLKLDAIDLYQLHRLDSKVPFEKTFEFLKTAQREGKIKHIGLSEVSIEEIKKAQEFVKVVLIQNMYSVDNRKWEAELQYCLQNGIAFIPWFPLNANNLKAMEKLESVGKKFNASPQ